MPAERENAYDIMRNNRRAEIIETTKRLILDEGMDAVNKANLAEKLGISRVTLHKYFKSVDEIILEIQKQIVSTTLKPEYLILQDNMDSDDICGTFRKLLNYAFDHAEELIFTNIFGIYMRNKKDNPELRDVYVNFVTVTDTFPAYIAYLQRENRIRTDLSSEQIAYTLNYILVGALERILLMRSSPKYYVPISQEDYISALLEMITAYLQIR